MNRFKLAFIIAAVSFVVLLLTSFISKKFPQVGFFDWVVLAAEIGGIVALLMGGLGKFFFILGKLWGVTWRSFLIPFPFNVMAICVMFTLFLMAVLFLIMMLPIIPVTMAYLENR